MLAWNRETRRPLGPVVELGSLQHRLRMSQEEEELEVVFGL